MEFQEHVDSFYTKILVQDAKGLPIIKQIAPNQHSWLETAAIMNVPVKSKKRKNIDPYGRGKQSGKKARTDARQPK